MPAKTTTSTATLTAVDTTIRQGFLRGQALTRWRRFPAGRDRVIESRR
jgi:hypothetical protein